MSPLAVVGLAVEFVEAKKRLLLRFYLLKTKKIKLIKS